MKLHTLFRDAPIKRKLLLLGLLTSGLALLFISLILTTGAWFEWRDRTVSDMTTHARIIGKNAGIAVLFEDQQAATETLAALAASPDVVDAVLYDKQGRMFARYVASRHSSFAENPPIKPGAYLFHLDRLVVVEPVRFKDEVVGSIYLESDLRSLYAGILRDVELIFIAALGVFLATIFLFARMQRIIVTPLLELSDGMRKVSDGQDYSVRVAVHGKDEIGVLAGIFNDMLTHIRQRDEELAQHREHLEQEVAQRTASLTAAQHFTAQIIEAIPMRVFWKDLDLRYLGCNTQFAQDAGLSRPDELVGKSDFEMGWREQAELYRADDRRVMDFNMPKLSYDEPQTTPDGGRIWLRTSKVPLRNETDAVFGVLGIYEDVTGYKQTEFRLRESEERFRKAFQNSAVGMALVGLDGSWLKVNDALCQIVGYSEQALLGKTFQDITHPDDLQADLGFVTQLLAGEIDHYQMEKRYFHQDGHVVWIRLSVSLIRDAEGNPLHFVSQIDDITERKQAAQALAESELKFRTILDSAMDGVLVADGVSHKFVTANRAICNMLGYSLDELYQLGMEDIHPAESLPFVAQQFERQLGGKMRTASGLPVRRKDGSVFFADVSASPMVLVERAFLVGVFHDVTERKQAEELVLKLNEELEIKVQQRTRQLLATQEELVRKEKLAVLGQVAGSVGHELRNPLGVMSNAVYFLQTVLSDADETTREYLGIIRDEIASSERIVSDLLDSVRTKPPQPEIVGVADLIGVTLGKLTIPASVTVRLDIPETLPSWRVDAQQIHQVLRNLISNGAEAMPQGGMLDIGAQVDEGGKSVTVSVRDNGVGMTEEQLGHLFQPLFTTKARGIGLGLVVVKNLTQANGGTVRVESVAGKGSTFAVTLPCGEREGASLCSARAIQ